jgi:hypothetical protein
MGIIFTGLIAEKYLPVPTPADAENPVTFFSVMWNCSCRDTHNPDRMA